MQPQTLQSRAASSPDVPVQDFRPPDVPVRVRFFPGRSSPGSVRLSACPCVTPGVPVQGAPLPCGFFLAVDAPVRDTVPPFFLLPASPVVSFCAAPSSPSLSHLTCVFFVSSPFRSLLLFMFSLTGLPLFLLTAPPLTPLSPATLASSPLVPLPVFSRPDDPVRVALLPAGTFFPG